jgi:two-component system, NarL family, invasion response regulator UvrY
MKRILIVDDHSIIRQAIKNLLEDCLGKFICGEAANGEQALQQIRTKKWNIVLLDLNLPDMTGLDVLQAIGPLVKTVPVLMFTHDPKEECGVDAIKLGAWGFISKSSTSDEIVAAVKHVLAEKFYISKTLAINLANHLHGKTDHLHELLSPRELDVLKLLASGKTQKEAAAAMGLSIKIVSVYHSSLLAKMRMTNDSQLKLYAVTHHLFHLKSIGAAAHKQESGRVPKR